MAADVVAQWLDLNRSSHDAMHLVDNPSPATSIFRVKGFAQASASHLAFPGIQKLRFC